jgi:hypothetical protein
VGEAAEFRWRAAVQPRRPGGARLDSAGQAARGSVAREEGAPCGPVAREEKR